MKVQAGLCLAAPFVSELLATSCLQVGNSSSFIFTASEKGSSVRRTGEEFTFFFFPDRATAGLRGL